MMTTPRPSISSPDVELPVKPGTNDDPRGPREIENPGDPGPTTLVPPERNDPRTPPDLPARTPKPPPGI